MSQGEQYPHSASRKPNMKLIVVESPAKARKIKTFLGDEYTVEASCGHIQEIPQNLLGVDIENGFAPTYITKEDKHDVVAKIRSLAARAEEIFVASDPDREGEFIASSIIDVMPHGDQAKCKRITYHEITKKAILHAIEHPRDLDVNLVDAAKSRQVLDRLIGYKVSPAVWNAVGKGTSAGRVQSVALKLLCDRQREIDAFKPTVFWYVDVLLGCSGGEFSARVVVPKDKENRFYDKKVATDALEKLQKASYLMGDVQKASKASNPFPPFDTNSLQGACSAILKWDITKAMRVAQTLYEQGKISYIRTDSFNVSEEALKEVRDHISGEHGEAYLPKKPNVYVKKAAAASQEAHECIRPTHMGDSGDDLDGDNKRLYDLVRDRFIACQMTPMVVASVKYMVDASSGEKLLATGQSISFDGFSKVWRHKDTDAEALPNAEKGEELQYKNSKQTEEKTKPPKRYTDASLANKLEQDGVGRPATRAPIIKSLEEKGYLTKDKTALVPTPMGFSIVDFLAPAFAESFMDIKFTAGMESEMLEIAEGKAGFVNVVGKFWDALKTNIDKVKGTRSEAVKTGVKCPVCGAGEIVEKSGKFGMFFTCNGYPACKSTFKKDGDNFVPSEKKKVVGAGKQCPKCDKPMVIRDSAYGKFVACSGFPACKHKEKFVEEAKQ